MLVGIGIALTGQHHFTAQGSHGINFELRRGGGHDDDGAAAQLARPQGHALGVVTGRGANHPALQLARGEVGHFVVRAAQLEAEYRLLVFALE